MLRLHKTYITGDREMSKRTINEVVDLLNLWAGEINEKIRSEPCKITGHRRFNPTLSKFYSNRSQLGVLEAYIGVTVLVGVDIVEPHSKKLLIERMLAGIEHVQALLEEHADSLTELLGVEKNETED